jgi:L-lactate dehydrogenase complex protein LldG
MFGARLEELQGSFEIVDRATDVADRIIDRIRRQNAESEEQDGNCTPVLAWAAGEIPVPGLEQRLTESGIELLVPGDLHDRESRARAARATTGITGVDAAFASTGSVMLVSGPGKSRAASLLPLHHLVIVPMTKIYPTFEHWLRSLRQLKQLETLLRENGQISFVTGPSKSADIELNLTLGVHGPKTVHAVVFDDR